MKRLFKFLYLTSSDRLLLVKTAFLLAVIRVGLKFLPFQTLRRLLSKNSQPTAKLQEPDSAFVDRVVWAVGVASRYVQGVRCLAQALATQVLLEQRGYFSDLRIGFTRSKGGQMSAHAWVESQGQVVIGGAGNMARYIPVPIPLVESNENGSWHLLT